MSLFVRMTQTRVGAERLLEAQLIPVLAKCDYLDARPEADQSFMGKSRLHPRTDIPLFVYPTDQDSFLPSAIQRYHQLFMPVLQLVDGMLATLGAKHSTITNQVKKFLPTNFHLLTFYNRPLTSCQATAQQSSSCSKTKLIRSPWHYWKKSTSSSRSVRASCLPSPNPSLYVHHPPRYSRFLTPFT